MRNSDNDPSSRLWYLQPAASWEEALPVGNGKLGAMVFGGIEFERMDLNEDTLWSGFPRDPNNYDAIRHLARVREAVSHGRNKEAEEIAERHMLGTWNESYLPLGTLHVEQHNLCDVEQYQRELSLKTGIASTMFLHKGIAYTREIFASAPDKLIVVSFTSSEAAKISLTVRLTSQLKHSIQGVAGDVNQLNVLGRCPSHVEPNYVEDHPNPILYEEDKGLRFATSLKAISHNGSIFMSDAGEMEIQNADSVTLLLAAVTDYEEDNSCEAGLNLSSLCQCRLNKGSAKSYAQLKGQHIADFEALYNRIELQLEHTETSHLPTDLRIEAVNKGLEDPDLAALYYHYARYLLISSSRKGSQPANLQGIWSKEIRAPWGSNWTTNINLQMNYWHAETANLNDCHKPLLSWIDRLAQKGKRTALIHYNCRGWAAHHNVDIWLDSSPASGQAVWAMWPMAGAWLCSHLWEHYTFNCDLAYLKDEAYPIMKEAALFYLDWLITDENSGFLVTNPSTSPENKFITADGEPCALTMASTLDLLLIRELFSNCIAATEAIDQDHEWAMEWQVALSRLHPLQIGKDGRLQEWASDYEEWEPGHRHLSHLYGLYPGNLLRFERDSDLVHACRRSLEHRLKHGGGYTGWSCAWSMALWARLRDGAQFHESWLSLLRTSTFPNLLDGHPYMVDTRIDYSRSIFQIDGNFGAAAAFGEMLLQSHGDELHFLPAIPAEWSEGKVRGLRARNGFTVNMEWSGGSLIEATVRSKNESICRIRSNVHLEAKDHFLTRFSIQQDYYTYEYKMAAGEEIVLKALK